MVSPQLIYDFEVTTMGEELGFDRYDAQMRFRPQLI